MCQLAQHLAGGQSVPGACVLTGLVTLSTELIPERGGLGLSSAPVSGGCLSSPFLVMPAIYSLHTEISYCLSGRLRWAKVRTLALHLAGLEPYLGQVLHLASCSLPAYLCMLVYMGRGCVCVSISMYVREGEGTGMFVYMLHVCTCVIVCAQLAVHIMR